MVNFFFSLSSTFRVGKTFFCDQKTSHSWNSSERKKQKELPWDLIAATARKIVQDTQNEINFPPKLPQPSRELSKLFFPFSFISPFPSRCFELIIKVNFSSIIILHEVANNGNMKLSLFHSWDIAISRCFHITFFYFFYFSIFSISSCWNYPSKLHQR